MADPPLIMAAALLSGLAVLMGTRPMLRWLPEPVPPDPNKVPYAELGTRRFLVGCTSLAVAAGLLSWATLPLVVQPLWTVLGTVGVLLASIDALTTWLPRRLTQVGWAAIGAAGLLGALAGGLELLVRAGAGAAIAGVAYLLVWWATRGGFGFGDVRFAPIIGAAAGSVSWPALLWTLVMGSVLGGVVGIIRLTRRQPGPFPYAPPMLLGAYLAAIAHWRSGGG